jgi:Family of unknown function (DUF6491)
MTAAAALALLAACATGSGGGAPAATTQERALARYQAYAGAPVQSFNWLGRFESWEPLGKDHLLVYTRPAEAYLLKISGPCDLRFAFNSVGISSTNSTVYQGLDSIVVRDAAAGGPWACRIDEIRPLDVRRMKAEMRAAPAGATEGQPPAYR